MPELLEHDKPCSVIVHLWTNGVQEKSLYIHRAELQLSPTWTVEAEEAIAESF